MTDSDLLTTLPESQRTLFLQAYEQARADGLCHDGALELAYERLKNGESGKKPDTHIIQTEPPARHHT